MAEISFSGRHFQREMIPQSVRWYFAYALSYRDIEEIMQERGFNVDHSTIHRWVIHYSPQLVEEFRALSQTRIFAKSKPIKIGASETLNGYFRQSQRSSVQRSEYHPVVGDSTTGTPAERHQG